MDSGEFKTTIRSSILILLFEGIGTFFLTLLFICNNAVSAGCLCEEICRLEYLAWLISSYYLMMSSLCFIEYHLNLSCRTFVASFWASSFWSSSQLKCPVPTIILQSLWLLFSGRTLGASRDPLASHTLCSKSSADFWPASLQLFSELLLLSSR